MAVDDIDTVDIISDDPLDRVVLRISDHLDWDDSLTHQLLLQKKLNRYLAFIESGELFEHRPASSGRRLAIRIEFKCAPDVSALEFLEQARAIVERAGIDFEYSRFPVFDAAEEPTISAERVQRLIDEEGMF